MDEFEDVACAAHLPAAPMDQGKRHARQRAAMAKGVSRICRTANDRLQADMLTHLVRPLSLLGLVAVASGAFARRGSLLSVNTAPAVETNHDRRRIEGG